jgi:hypothetical protein
MQFLKTPILIFIFFIFFISHTFSQSVPARKTIYPHTIFWNKIEVAEILNNSKFGIGGDLIHRRSNELGAGTLFDRHVRTSFRPWVHYQFGPYSRFSFSPLGYFYSQGYAGRVSDLNRMPHHELRTTFQFFHHHVQMGGKLMHTWRYRYELRNQHNPELDEYTFFNRFRFRYRIRYIINTPDFYTPGTIYAMAANEIGVNFGKNVIFNSFNQNRVYVGIGARVMNAARVELRYVNLFTSRRSGFEFDHGNGFMISLNIDQATYLGRRYTKPIKFTD